MNRHLRLGPIVLRWGYPSVPGEPQGVLSAMGLVVTSTETIYTHDATMKPELPVPLVRQVEGSGRKNQPTLPVG